MLNRTRQLYHKILNSNRPSETQQNKTISAAENFKNLKKHPGWKQIEEFLEKQRSGQHEFLQYETSVQNATLLGLINNFFKYRHFLIENRAYTKLEQYIEVTIKNGEKYAAARAKAEERAERARTS